jgi:hypothetical protein
MEGTDLRSSEAYIILNVTGNIYNILVTTPPSRNGPLAENLENY